MRRWVKFAACVPPQQIRAIHMTSTKREQFWFEDDPSAQMNAQCPLLAFMVEYSRGNHSTAYAIADSESQPRLRRQTT